MRIQLTAFWSTVIFSCIGVMVAHGACPPPEAILERLDKLDLTAAARTQGFQLEPPNSLYEKAAAKPGKVAVQKEGKLGHAVLLTDLPIEDLWMAINDEDHYAEDGYIPVLHSEVVGGTSRGQDRILFQYFKQAGVGRWWVDEVVMSNELFVESDTMLWELRWRDLMETYTEQSLPANLARQIVDLDLSPIRASRGAWLMIPIDAECTLVEYVTYSDPGGFLSLAQWLGAGRVMRDTLAGVEAMARKHFHEPHPEATFVRPDGTPMAPATR